MVTENLARGIKLYNVGKNQGVLQESEKGSFKAKNHPFQFHCYVRHGEKKALKVT